MSTEQNEVQIVHNNFDQTLQDAGIKPIPRTYILPLGLEGEEPHKELNDARYTVAQVEITKEFLKKIVNQ